MRAVIVSLVVGACILGAAFTQNASSHPPSAQAETAAFEPQYEGFRRPDRVYPRWASDRNISGFTDTCCGVRADRTLDCRVAREWPERAGFGRAALRLNNGQRLTQASNAELQTRRNQVVQISNIWVMAPIGAGDADALAAARGNAANICAPYMRAPEPVYVAGRVNERP